MAGARSDDDTEFALKVHLFGQCRVDDFVPLPDQRRWRLEKEERLFRNLVAELAGVLGIVPAHANNFAGCSRREQSNAIQSKALSAGEDLFAFYLAVAD